MPAKPTRRSKQKPAAKPAPFIIIAGIVILIVMVFVLKNQPAKPEAATPPLSAEEQLDQYLEEKVPVFVFFHSNNCHSCLVMVDTVNVIYPEFAGLIKLVDIDVYDPQNQNLLARAQIRSIPTQVFFDQSGQAKVMIGVMSSDELRQQFLAMSGDEQ